MLIAENKSIKSMTSLKIGGTARYFGMAACSDDIVGFIAFAKAKDLPLCVLGGGTNTIAPDDTIDAVVVKMAIMGKRIDKEFPESIHVEFGAGENWDDIVAWSVQEGLSGLEALSGIPGTVGAAPVQNIGAYGAELSNVFIRARAVSTETGEEIHISLPDCDFAYRNSNFKQYPGQYIITHVTLELSKKAPTLPDYKDVTEYFKDAKRKPTLAQIRKAILEIRQNKLPDPSFIPNAGSFFVNPIVCTEHADGIQKVFPNMPRFDLDNETAKIPAGWLIEQAGLKGANFGHVGTYNKNALVIVTDGEATHADLEKAISHIQQKVHEMFGIDLVVEPRTLGRD